MAQQAADTPNILVVEGRFYEDIAEELVKGAEAELREAAVKFERVTVPGAFEIPLAAAALAKRGRDEAVITLGAVVRGETPHFDYVAGECARGVARVSLECDLPIIFGVLTVDTMDQGLARAGGAVGNKGEEAADAALEMVTLMRTLAQ